MRILKLVLLCSLTFTGAGCSLSEMAVDQMVPVLEQTRNDFNRGTVVENARRSGPARRNTIDGRFNSFRYRNDYPFAPSDTRRIRLLAQV